MIKNNQITVKISKRNQISIPAKVMKTLKLSKGARLKVVVNPKKGTFTLEEMPSIIDRMRGILKGITTYDQVMRHMNEDREKEDRDLEELIKKHQSKD